jgi:hypothetical protein
MNCFIFSFRLLDNRTPSPSSGVKFPNLVNSTPSLIKQASLTRDRPSLHHVESSASLSSEKVSLMTAEEQSSVVQPLLTDFYQISMAYAYWKAKKHQEMSTFDLYFRKNRK